MRLSQRRRPPGRAGRRWSGWRWSCRTAGPVCTGSADS